MYDLVRRNAAFVAVFDGPVAGAASVSSSALPGTIFVARRKTSDLWPAFDVIVHESCHQEAGEVERHIGDLVRDDVQFEITIPWATKAAKGDLFSARRITYASHAFAVQAAAYALATGGDHVSLDWHEYVTSRKVLYAERASFLISQLLHYPSPALTDFGLDFVHGLDDLLSGLGS